MFFLRLLGGVSLEGPSGPLTGRVVQRRRLALLALLAAEGEKGCSRDKLVGYLWPESDETTARRLLSDSLYVVRQALGEGCVLTSGELVRLNPEVVRTDLVDFERALEAEDLQRAVELYGGPFLEGFHSGAAAEFDHWRDSESRRLADLYAGALESLARAAEESGDSARAVVWWKRLAAHDPHNSRPALRLAEAMAAAGDRANALEYALQHERLVRDEALGWYTTVSQHSVYDKIYLAPSHLRRAEIYERLGDRDKAALHYARFIELWADSDSEFQPQVEGARRALRSLSRER